MGDNQLMDTEMGYDDITDFEEEDDSDSEQPEENEPTDEPLDVNYIYTNEGIVQVPHTLIERDKGYPISVSAQAWRENQKSHVRVSGALFAANRVVDARSIVVLTQVNPYNGAYERCLWFARFSVEGGSDKFEQPFGENFLWQLGHPTCMKYLET